MYQIDWYDIISYICDADNITVRSFRYDSVSTTLYYMTVITLDIPKYLDWGSIIVLYLRIIKVWIHPNF